jgi:hypothetical protein
MQRDPSPILTTTYGTALSIFGSVAVQSIIESSSFVQQYPELALRIQSIDIRIKYDTMMPENVMLAIADRAQCSYDFWEDPSEESLSAQPASNLMDGSRNAQGWIKLNRRIALSEYGAFGLFQAVDGPQGYKREHDYRLDWLGEQSKP